MAKKSNNTIIKKNICEVCGINAIFNFQSLKHGRFCLSHKEIGMVNVRDNICIKEDCNLTASFNFEGELKRIYCNSHKETGMVNVKNRKCKEEGCNSTPSYNVKEENTPIFCKRHKEDNMVNVKDKKCISDGCLNIPSFNYESNTKGILCSIHKTENMVDVIHKKCEKEGCNSSPGFNFKGETKRRFCEKHKEDNMVNVKTKKCLNNGCEKVPSFNYINERVGKYCIDHKKDFMVNVKTKKCISDCCERTASFNIEGKQAKYCFHHKLPNMINNKHSYCIYENCKTRAYYGYCGQPLTHCNQHKLDYMIRKTKRTCSGNDEEDCKECATYGKDEPLHCVDHSLEGEICWLVKRCSNCGRDNEILNKDNLCGICCDKPFYEESKRVNKLKETIMVKYLRNKVKGQEILADRIIDSTCNLYRPDILYDCGTHIVVIECDENQHKNYPWETCSLNKSLEHMEEKRMYEIMVAYGLPAVFIRWNPDAFKVNGVVNKKYNNDKRLEMLIKWVNYCFNKMEVSHGLVYKKLFYDEYQEDDLSFKRVEEEDLV
jgi:hypothetical protein